MAPETVHVLFNSETISVGFSITDIRLRSTQRGNPMYGVRMAKIDIGDHVGKTMLKNPLRSFVAVKNLYLLEEFVPRIAPALQELVGGRMTEVLPTLENIFLGRRDPFVRA